MEITIKDDSNRALVMNKVDYHFNNNSRFTCDVEPIGYNSRFKVRNVRLRESKIYCGSHPYACDIAGGRRGKYLEGADWVDFNDQLNDVLDDLEVSAWVRSSVCEIRFDRRRRVAYDGYLANPYRNEYQWDKKGEVNDYEDWCGKIAPDSLYPEGTPGEYTRERLMPV